MGGTGRRPGSERTSGGPKTRLLDRQSLEIGSP
jgi:hypothetical protein